MDNPSKQCCGNCLHLRTILPSFEDGVAYQEIWCPIIDTDLTPEQAGEENECEYFVLNTKDA